MSIDALFLSPSNSCFRFSLAHPIQVVFTVIRFSICSTQRSLSSNRSWIRQARFCHHLLAKTTSWVVSTLVFISCAFLRITFIFFSLFQFSHNLFFHVRFWKITEFMCTFSSYLLIRCRFIYVFTKNNCSSLLIISIQDSVTPMSCWNRFKFGKNSAELQNRYSFCISSNTVAIYFESLISFFSFLQSYSHVYNTTYYSSTVVYYYIIFQKISKQKK